MYAYHPCTRSVTLTNVSSCQQSFPPPGRVASHLHEHMLWHLLQRCRVRLARTCIVFTLSIWAQSSIAVLIRLLGDSCRFEWLPAELPASWQGCRPPSRACALTAAAAQQDAASWGLQDQNSLRARRFQLECSNASTHALTQRPLITGSIKYLVRHYQPAEVLLPAALDTGHTCLSSGQSTRFEDTRLPCQHTIELQS